MGANTGATVAALKPKIGGALWRAPLGTAVPTDSSTALAAAFKCLGPITKDGVKPARETNIESPQEWDGSVLVDLLDSDSRAFELTLVGFMDRETQEFVHRTENVTVVAASASKGTTFAILDKGGKPDPCVLVLEMSYGSVPVRKVIEIADPTVTDENPYVGSGLVGYTVRINAKKGATGLYVATYFEKNDKTA